MPAKRVKKIMFRLLDLEKLSVFLKCNVPGTQGYSTLEEKTADGEETICEADIYIEDNYLEEQSGVYHFLLKNGKVLIQKTGDTKGDCKESISVAAFTEYLFGAEDRLKVFWHMIRVLFLLSGIFFDFFIDKSEEIE